MPERRLCGASPRRTASAGAAPMTKRPSSPDYGPLRPRTDQTTGLELLSLPVGFEYLSYGWTGDI
jgi:uncharacterized protein